MQLGLLKKSLLMEGTCCAMYLTLALHRRERSSLEKPLKKCRGFLNLCAIFVALGIQTGQEIAGLQPGHNSNAGDNVDICKTQQNCALWWAWLWPAARWDEIQSSSTKHVPAAQKSCLT